MLDTIINKILEKALSYKDKKEIYLVAIDGPCCSGKTTLANEISKLYESNIIHMDDFFIPMKEREENFFNSPNGNIDYNRFLNQVLIPMHQKENFYYKKFNCSNQQYDEAILFHKKYLNIIEGSYSLHKRLKDYYDLKIFLNIENKEQIKRLEKRVGKKNLKNFKNIWIPMEENYFKTYEIKKSADFCFDMGD